MPRWQRMKIHSAFNAYAEKEFSRKINASMWPDKAQFCFICECVFGMILSCAQDGWSYGDLSNHRICIAAKSQNLPNQHLYFMACTHGVFQSQPNESKKGSCHDHCFDVCRKVEWSRISERRLVKSHTLKWSLARLHFLCRINLICKNMEYGLQD